MPEPISRDTAVATLPRLGYEKRAEANDFVVFYDVAFYDRGYPDRGYPERPLNFDFSRGPIPWDDFRRQLEYEGLNVATFLAELESM